MTDSRTRPIAKTLTLRPALAPALALGLALALTGCKGEAEETGAVQSGGQAAGEVLGGTISDDMLPLEQLTSTSPLAPRETVTQTVTEGEDGSMTVETTIERTLGAQDTPPPIAPPQNEGQDNEAGPTPAPIAAPTVAPALVPAPQPPDLPA